MIRVMLVDDHTSFRQALAFMIGREADLTVVAQAGTLASAQPHAGAGIDVAVVDLSLPDGDGCTLVRQLRRFNPYAAVLILTGSTDRRDVARAVEAGAAGVLNKSVGVDEIIAAIRTLDAGGYLLSPAEIVELVRFAGDVREQAQLARERLAHLTARERDVLQCLAEGLNDRQIAERLSISTETVKTHMVNLLGKLDVDSRLAALVYALRHHAVEIE